MNNNYYFYTKNMAVGYNKIPLIKDINIGIHKGEILTLIGPNGSGKSTILKNIIRDLSAIAGLVYIDGKEIKEYSGKEYAKKLAVVLTQKIKTDMMTCRDVVEMGRYPYTNYFGHMTEKDNSIVEESLNKVNAVDIAEKDFTCISDGQRQRIMLARAICQQPEVIVLDEPTSFLDIKNKFELLSILRNMAVKDKVTVIMSLHEIELAAKISDYVMCVGKNKTIEFDIPEKIFTQENITRLYGLKNAVYNPLTGSVELKSISHNPKVFVIGGGGYGIKYYRELQKLGVPFSSGIIFNNDIDYPISKALACETIEEEKFCIISDENYNKACNIIDMVEYVIDSGCPVYEQNNRISNLILYAKSKNKKVYRCPEHKEIKQILHNL